MKIIILSFIVMTIISCGSSKSSFPSNINIKKNQLRYIDDTMQIWANDGDGKHHNYSPKDSSEYKFVTNHIGSNLNSVFVGYCKLHRLSEVVSVGPEIVHIVATRKIMNIFDQNKISDNNSINFINPSDISYPTSSGSGGTTHSTIQSENKADTKN